MAMLVTLQLFWPQFYVHNPPPAVLRDSTSDRISTRSAIILKLFYTLEVLPVFQLHPYSILAI